MRAVGVTEFGGPEALQLVDVPAEPLGPGQVRVRVTAATINPTDTYARNGTYAGRDPVKEFPYVPGMDVAGELAEIGEGVDRHRGRRARDGHRRPDRRPRRLPGGHRAARPVDRPGPGRRQRRRGLDVADERAHRPARAGH